MPNNTLIFAKRSLNLSKIYSGIGIFFASFGIFISDVITFLAKGAPESLFLIAIPFMAFGILMFSTSVILLYVYDKNNGVLEYLLSLGWNQSDIFKRYLRTALFLALTLFIAEFAANVVSSVIAGTTLFSSSAVSSRRRAWFLCRFFSYSCYDGFQFITKAESGC